MAFIATDTSVIIAFFSNSSKNICFEPRLVPGMPDANNMNLKIVLGGMTLGLFAILSVPIMG